MSYDPELMNSFKEYILNTNNISSINIYNIHIRQELREYIRNTLKQVNQKCYDAFLLRKRRAEIRQDIEDIYTSFVGGDSYSLNEQGKNTGMKNNPNELKHIKIGQLKEELNALTNQTLLLEASVEEHKKLIRDVLDMLLDPEAAKCMKLFYLECISNRELANEFQFSIDGIKKLKSRSINKLVDFVLDKN